MGEKQSIHRQSTIQYGSSESSLHTVGLHDLGSNAPLVVMLTILFAMPLCTFGLQSELLVSILSVLFTSVLSVILIVLSHERSVGWRWYSYGCLVSGLAGAGLGTYYRGMRASTASTFAAISILVVLYALLAWLLLRLMKQFGYRMIGSSRAFQAKYGWGWNEKAFQQLLYGVERSGEEGLHVMISKPNLFPMFVARGLLKNRCCWSGEPATDYVFYAANDHSFIGCFLCHPMHPFEKSERWFVLVILVLLIVFPVATFMEAMPDTFMRQALIIVLVTAPRNGLKALLRRVVLVKDEHIFDALQDKEIDAKEYAAVQAAERQQNVFFLICIAVTVTVVAGSCVFLAQHHSLNRETITEACIGIVYFFVLEFCIHLVLPHMDEDGWLHLGFFGKWWAERYKYAQDDDDDLSSGASGGTCAADD